MTRIRHILLAALVLSGTNPPALAGQVDSLRLRALVTAARHVAERYRPDRAVHLHPHLGEREDGLGPAVVERLREAGIPPYASAGLPESREVALLTLGDVTRTDDGLRVDAGVFSAHRRERPEGGRRGGPAFAFDIHSAWSTYEVQCQAGTCEVVGRRGTRVFDGEVPETCARSYFEGDTDAPCPPTGRLGRGAALMPIPCSPRTELVSCPRRPGRPGWTSRPVIPVAKPMNPIRSFP